MSVFARQRTGAGLEAEAGEEAWRGQGVGHPGGATGPGGLSPVAQGRGLRRRPLLAGPAGDGPALSRGNEDLTGSSSLSRIGETSHATDRFATSARRDTPGDGVGPAGLAGPPSLRRAGA